MPSETQSEIPMAVCSVVGRILGETYYNHSRLNALFHEAGAPGDPPPGNCVAKCTCWLKQCNDDPNTDAFFILGSVLSDPMETWSSTDDPIHLERKAKIEQKLAEYGLRYYQGKVIGGASSPASKDLQSIIQSRDIPSLRVEFDRAIASIEADPEVAITAACAIFEAFCNIYMQNEGITPPAKIGAQTLWKTVRSHMKLNPNADMDKDLNQILNGLASVLNGVSSLRNRSGSAHGRGRREYRVETRHARLAVNAAHALVLFLMEVWDHRKMHSASEKKR